MLSQLDQHAVLCLGALVRFEDGLLTTFVPSCAHSAAPVWGTQHASPRAIELHNAESRRAKHAEEWALLSEVGL